MKSYTTKILQHHQCQPVKIRENNLKISLRGLHPVLQILFVIQPENEILNFSEEKEELLISGRLLINGRVGTNISPLTSHLDRYINGLVDTDLPIYTITFGPIPDIKKIHTESVSTLNMNHIDDIQLELQLKVDRGTIKIWYFNYNVLKIQGGMGILLATP